MNRMSSAGFKLDYVAFFIYNGKEIDYIEVEDIKSEIDYWNITVVYYVLGVNFLVSVFFDFIR